MAITPQTQRKANQMTNTIQIPVTIVSAKAQSVVRDIDPSTFHPDAIAAIFEYGLRRWFQDSINSQAHIARQAETEFDAEAAFADRLEQAVSGEISRRGGGSSVSDDTIWNRRAVRELARVNANLKAALADLPDTDARNELLDHVAAKNPDVVAPVVERLRKADAAKRKAASDAASALSL